jgi:hypothetical protein
MNAESTIPELMIVRVRTGGGPFAPGDTLSVAFTSPSVGRMLAHDDAGRRPWRAPSEVLVPESISGIVVSGCDAYPEGQCLTLSFVDGRFARLHVDGAGAGVPAAPLRATVSAIPAFDALAVEAAPVRAARRDDVFDVSEPARSIVAPTAGVIVRLAWTNERARRFVQVVDKLFAVNRLGWYRHVFAMRLLVPDEIRCGDETATRVAAERLQCFRAAAIETLGRPLLAAFMPNFSVTSEWLDSIDTPTIARAFADVRDAIEPFATDDDVALEVSERDDRSSFGFVSRSGLRGATATADAFLPELIPARSARPGLAEHLAAYRAALADVFAQTAGSAEAVRLGRMSEPNHVLDDRLWQLTGAVGSLLEPQAVA